MPFLLRKRSNLYIVDTFSQRKLLGSDGVRYREVSLYFPNSPYSSFSISCLKARLQGTMAAFHSSIVNN